MLPKHLQRLLSLISLFCMFALMGQSHIKMSKKLNEKAEFPKTLEGFGYQFNAAGQLRDIESGIPFRFEVKQGDRSYNQRHYDALGLVVDNHVFQLLEENEALEKVEIPLDAVGHEPRSFVFMSEGFAEKDKILLLIHGSGVVRAGQWSRSLIINHSLESGSQIPYIRKAKQDGYGVIVLNTNQNYGVLANKAAVRGSEDPQQHFLYVWDKMIMRSKARHIAIMAHSYGGHVVVNGLKERPGEMMDRVFAIAMSDSVHSLDSSRLRSTGPAKQWFIKHSQNWVSSHLPLDRKIEYGNQDDCKRVSAGTKKHIETSWYVLESVFKYFKEKLIEKAGNIELDTKQDINEQLLDTEVPMSQDQELQAADKPEHVDVLVPVSNSLQEEIKRPVENDELSVPGRVYERESDPVQVSSEKQPSTQHMKDEF